MKPTGRLFAFLAVAVDNVSRARQRCSNVRRGSCVGVELGKLLKLSLKIHLFQDPASEQHVEPVKQSPSRASWALHVALSPFYQLKQQVHG